MTNFVLFLSSIVLGLVNLYGLLLHPGLPHPFQFAVTTGVMTSVWNHGSEMRLAVLADRLTMCTCIVLEYYYIFTQIDSVDRHTCAMLLTIAMCSYMLAKFVELSAIHCVAHVIITINHFVMMNALY